MQPVSTRLAAHAVAHAARNRAYPNMWEPAWCSTCWNMLCRNGVPNLLVSYLSTTSTPGRGAIMSRTACSWENTTTSTSGRIARARTAFCWM